MQRALLGEVPLALRGVTVGWRDAALELRCYFDGPVSEADRESMECMASEVIADFPESRVDLAVIQRDAPAAMESLDAWAYHRQECG